MGLFDKLNRYALAGYAPDPNVMERHDIAEVIAEAIAQRSVSFSLDDALELPAVNRGVSLLCSTAASLPIYAYRNGIILDAQPRLVTSPSPLMDRYTFVYQTMYGLVTEGTAYWRVLRTDGRVTGLIVIPKSEVNVTWNSNKTLPVFQWRNQTLRSPEEIVQITIGQRPGELEGHGPIKDGLTYLQTIALAEDYARGVFQGGAIPPVIVHTKGKITAEEAAKIKAQWQETRSNQASAAIIGDGFELTFPSTTPEAFEMSASRSYGNTVVATVLGIPASLLLVQGSGSFVTYSNAGNALVDMTKTTLIPTYLAPIEARLSELLPGRQTVKFSPEEILRADFTTRIAIYKELQTMGVLSTEQIAQLEGWSLTATDESSSVSTEEDTSGDNF